jgi:hypothetical protein
MILIEWWEKRDGRRQCVCSDYDSAFSITYMLNRDDIVTQWRLPLHGEHDFPWYKKTDFNKCRPDLRDWKYE